MDKIHGHGHSGQNSRSQWTKAPRYNKCWSLEILQDNSKALAGGCLEEWAMILPISQYKKTTTSATHHTLQSPNTANRHCRPLGTISLGILKFYKTISKPKILKIEKKAPTKHMPNTSMSKTDPTLPNQKSPSPSKKRNGYSYLHTSSNEKRKTEK